ncbi:VOC family protein [Streptococcus hyovaginalis]
MADHQLLGIHHVTVMTDSAEHNYRFFTEALSMRLVKKTVNQDDIQTYHTFFADDKGSAGTDITSFDSLGNPKAMHGINAITRASFRVPDDATLKYYQERFDAFGVKHEGIIDWFGVKALPFEEEDGQRYQLGRILIEISTDDPGFETDDPYETLGERLSLPSFLESERDLIERTIRPFNTQRHHS